MHTFTRLRCISDLTLRRCVFMCVYVTQVDNVPVLCRQLGVVALSVFCQKQ